MMDRALSSDARPLSRERICWRLFQRSGSSQERGLSQEGLSQEEVSFCFEMGVSRPLRGFVYGMLALLAVLAEIDRKSHAGPAFMRMKSVRVL
ncbi:hypothetical protein BDW66DRAFT_128382 [Aspergillus desertorum]